MLAFESHKGGLDGPRTCDVRNLENRTYPPRNELGGRIDTIFAIFYEYRYFPGALRLQDLRKLGDSLLQDLRRTYVNLGNNDHHRDVEREGDTQVFFGHPDEAVVCSNH